MGNDNHPRLIRIDTGEREVHLIPEGTMRIGRSRGLDLCLEDTAVSRFHCYLVREGDTVRAFDGESKNPALVDGEPVNGQQLKSGHTLRVGRCELIYEGPLPATAPEEHPAASAAVAPTRNTATRGRRARVRGTTRQLPSRSGLPLGLAVLMGVGVTASIAVLIWLAVQLSRSDRDPSGVEASAARRVEQSEAKLQQLLAELEQKLAAKEDTSRFTPFIEEQKKRIAELKAELERERDADRAGGKAAPSGVPAQSALSANGSIPFPELDTAPEKKDDEPAREASAKTIVVQSRPASVKRSKKEIGDLVARLCAKVDDYATHTVFPATLEPALSDLSSSVGKDAAEGVLAVYQHARGLLRQTDASIETNERRRVMLLKKAEQTTPVGSPPEGSGTKQEGSASKKGDPKSEPASGSGAKTKEKPAQNQGGMYGKAVGAQAETDQRLLEAFTKAAQIHKRHRDHLIPLRDAVLASIQRLTDTEALALLRSRLADESDVELCRAILPAFQAAAYRESVPTLYSRLGVTKDPALKAALVTTLASVTGVDLGDKAPAWAEWWNKNGR